MPSPPPKVVSSVPLELRRATPAPLEMMNLPPLSLIWPTGNGVTVPLLAPLNVVSTEPSVF